jgi:uncharacterized cupin superfamily protein
MTPDDATPIRPIASGDVPWKDWGRGARFGIRYRHMSRAALGEAYRVGVAIEELPPGRQSAPAHWHMLEEEHVYVLDGTLTARIGAARFPMKAGDYVCFPAGQRAGHCLINQSDSVCRYVIIGERNPDDVIVYPDSRKVLTRSLGKDAIFDLDATRGYWHGEDTGPADDAPPEPVRPAAEAPEPGRPPIASGEVAWDEWPLAAGFVDRNRHLTRAAVGEGYRVGVLIEGPPPGMRCAPRHYHMLEEEHALVLEGEVTLLLGDQRHVLGPGDYVAFPAGRRVGHSFLNSGTGPCAYLMIGERNPADVVVMPDSGKMVVRALAAHDAIFDMAARRGYLDGEPAG